MVKALITGISGFAGSFLAEYLISQKTYAITGTYLSSKSLENLTDIKKKLDLVQLDLTDQKSVSQLIESKQPEIVFHLAALSTVGASFEKPAETITNNVVAQVYLLEAIRKVNLTCRILIVSSADVYGKVAKDDLPIDEETKFNPTNAYAVSKIAQDFSGLQYFLSYNMQIIRARPFNHIGPRQSLGFVVSDFAQKIARIEKGSHEPVLKVGNLEPKRDFTDVRDMVRAYESLLKKGVIGDVYNIGSGKSYKISEILDILLSFSNVKIRVETESALLRPQDSLDRVCNNAKLVAVTGWKREIAIEQTLKDTLDYWRDIV